MPDAKRFKPVAAQSPSPDDDPRRALAQQYLQKAAADLAEKEAAQPRRAQVTRTGDPRPFSLSISSDTFLHVFLSTIAFTFAALALLWCYHVMMVNFTAGRVIALPTGIVVFASLGYFSVLFLGVIESTCTGRTDVDALDGDWQDWFWTLPSTLGMVALTAFFGWLLSLAIPASVGVLIALCVLFLYPILQLSSLETGSPLAPLSLPVLLSIGKHPFGWFILYAISFAATSLLWVVARAAWRDPPYLTVLMIAPLVSVALFFYAWLLGQLASLISSQEKKS